MNKYLIVLMAICLVSSVPDKRTSLPLVPLHAETGSREPKYMPCSDCLKVHAFVKRDTAAPAQTPNYLEDLQNQLQTLGKTINEKVKEAFNPEDLKKSIDQLAATANKLLTPAKEQKA